jgi:APA family basic amino acid/polyamine antiporter
MRAGCFLFIVLMPFLLLRKKRKSTKGMPIGILGSLVICTILYVLFAYVLTGLENYLNFKGDVPVTTAFAKNRLHILNSGLNCNYCRIHFCDVSNADGAKQSFYSMSVDGLLPKFFSDLHATNRTPYKTNLLLWYSLVYLRALFLCQTLVTWLV